MKKKLLLCLLSISITACNGWFDKDNTPPPTPLKNFKSEANIRSVWYTSTGSGTGKDYLTLAPIIDNNTIYTTDYRGTIAANDKTTGKSQWKVGAATELTAGAGAGDGIVVVGGRDGKIQALNQNDGQIRWQAQTSTEILASPVVKNNIAIVKSIDGKITAYSAQDGHLLWSYSAAEPNLILRGASTPKLTHDSAFIGFANGNLIKLTLRSGTLTWQKTIAIPEGSFTIQRMTDIDADPLLFGNRIYVATYQGRITALEQSSAQELWTHDISSYTGITTDSQQTYVTDARSHVWAFDANTGAVHWRQPELEARNITGPVIMGHYLVVGDSEGYLHWLSKEDGHVVARTRVNRSGIIATPLVENNILYVATKDGHLAAYTYG